MATKRSKQPKVYPPGVFVTAAGMVVMHDGEYWFTFAYEEAIPEAEVLHGGELRPMLVADDTTIDVYRIHRHGFGKDVTIGNRRQLGATVGYFKTLPKRDYFSLRIERATALGFTDVTDEFLGPDA